VLICRSLPRQGFLMHYWAADIFVLHVEWLHCHATVMVTRYCAWLLIIYTPTNAISQVCMLPFRFIAAALLYGGGNAWVGTVDWYPMRFVCAFFLISFRLMHVWPIQQSIARHLFMTCFSCQATRRTLWNCHDTATVTRYELLISIYLSAVICTGMIISLFCKHLMKKCYEII